MSSLFCLVAGCNLDSVERCSSESLASPGHHRCLLPGWSDRPFDIELPEGATGPLPFVLALHGGGGNADAAISITCPNGDRDDPSCLDHIALRRGYAIVTPNGTGLRPLRNSRTWNGGGGNDGYYCSAGPACASGVDDIAYFDDLLAELEAIAPIDRQRIYSTGLSNGASMTHRLACERPADIRAIAPFSGPSQHAESGGGCPGGVPVLQIHGTKDPCAPWEDSDTVDCASVDLNGLKVGVPRTMEGWRQRNGCGAETSEQAIPDADPGDGSTATHIRWQGCDSDVELIRVDGGGHTWPGGDAYWSADQIGTLNRDFLASELILDFFDAHP